MKKLLLLLMFCIAVCRPSYGQGAMAEVWNEANTAYVNSDYYTAISVYDSIVSAGYVSDKLFYNLGNAHFKENNIGKAILNYNRALKLNPSDKDIKHNLTIANQRVKDRIEEVPEFFLYTWIRAWRQTMSSNAWAVVSLIAFAAAAAAVLLYLLSARLWMRKVGFYAGIGSLFLAFCSIWFSVGQKQDLLHSKEAIVMAGAAPVKSSPDNASKDIFILHEGTRVNIISTLNEWAEISIADGNKGWIRQGSVEVI